LISYRLAGTQGGTDDEAVSTAAGGSSGAGHPEPHLSVAAVARRLGVAPATLRTWDRRYGLGPTRHSAGEHRRYGPADIARLEVLRRLVLDGVPLAEAAQVAVRRVPAPPPTDRLGPGAGRTDQPPTTAAGSGAAPAGGPPAGTGWSGPEPAGDGRVDTGRAAGCGPGGRILPIGATSPEVRGLARAAMTLDAAATWAAVEVAVRRDGVVPVWNALLRPVLAAIGTRWQLTGKGVEVEHLLTETATGVLRAGARAPEPVNGRPVLLACAPGEQHCLPLSALAAGLAEHRIGVRLLGGGLPVEALAAAVRRTGAAVVLVFAQLAETGRTVVLDALPTLRPRVTVLAGGAGWAVPLPEPVQHVPDLQAAVDAIRQVVA
jgi:transposase-like protein